MPRRSTRKRIPYVCAGWVLGQNAECMCQVNDALYYYDKDRVMLCESHMDKRFKGKLQQMVDSRELFLCSKSAWIKLVDSWTPTRISTRITAQALRGGHKCLGCGGIMRGNAIMSKMSPYICETCRTQATKDDIAQKKAEKMAAKVSKAAISVKQKQKQKQKKAQTAMHAQIARGTAAASSSNAPKRRAKQAASDDSPQPLRMFANLRTLVRGRAPRQCPQ